MRRQRAGLAVTAAGIDAAGDARRGRAAGGGGGGGRRRGRISPPYGPGLIARLPGARPGFSGGPLLDARGAAGRHGDGDPHRAGGCGAGGGGGEAVEAFALRAGGGPGGGAAAAGRGALNGASRGAADGCQMRRGAGARGRVRRSRLSASTGCRSRVVFGDGHARRGRGRDRAAGAAPGAAAVDARASRRWRSGWPTRSGPLAAGGFAGAVMHTPVEVTEAALAAWRGGAGAIAWWRSAAARRSGSARRSRSGPGADQVAVPTTYAGSEMTDILGETADGRKTTRRDPAILPETVIYDVALTLGLPPALTATSGLNALAHAVEALYAPRPQPGAVADGGARRCAALGAALPALAADPGDRAARATGALRRVALRRGARRHHDGAAPQALPRARRQLRAAACRDACGDAAARGGLQRRGGG